MPESQSRVILEARQLWSRSLIWALQRRYFAERGIDAWRRGEVPHYVTSSPAIARAYAEIVAAFLRDRRRLAPCDEPLHICELGAGSGRFAFQFLARLEQLCREDGWTGASPPFRYVLTDIVPENLEFWLQHPQLQQFFADGALDVAVFDLERSDRIALRRSGVTLTAGDLRAPLVVIANYVFDSVPQELYHVDAATGRCDPCLVSLALDGDLGGLDAGELLARVEVHCEVGTTAEGPRLEPALQRLLADYSRSLRDTYLLFPATALSGVQRLRALSRAGMLLLSADKGEHRLAALSGAPPPALVRHGSVSLVVNYHAFAAEFAASAGVALLPERPDRALKVCCFVGVDRAADHRETRAAYGLHVLTFGPEDYYAIAGHARRGAATMSVDEILAHARLGGHDSHQFAFFLPRLLELAPALDPDGRAAVRTAVDQVWRAHFAIGEAFDLAYHLACLLHAIDDLAGALEYFERSVASYGSYTGTLFNMAVCHAALGRPSRAAALLERVLRHDPDNAPARALFVQCTRAGQGAEDRLTPTRGG